MESFIGLTVEPTKENGKMESNMEMASTMAAQKFKEKESGLMAKDLNG